MRFKLSSMVGLLACIALFGCEDMSQKSTSTKVSLTNKNSYPLSYSAPGSAPLALLGANVLTGDGAELLDVDVWVADGKMVAIGADLDIPEGVARIAIDGRWLTPGLIDEHSRMGVYSAPRTANHHDGNEMTSPVTLQVWAEHSVWPWDPQFEKALAGGVTALQILPGSGNLIGGRGVTLKNVRSLTVQGMKFPGAPYSLKMACGENPKGYCGSLNQLPSTRMGNMAGYRAEWIEAIEYKRGWDNYVAATSAGADIDSPSRGLRLETLVGGARGRYSNS